MGITIDQWKGHFDRAVRNVKVQMNDPQNAFRVIPFLQDKRVQKFVAHWPVVKVSIVPGRMDVPKKDWTAEELWKWIWDHVQVLNSPATGMSDTLFEQMVDRAKATFLIYPDNTVNRFAQTFLSNMVIQKMTPTKKTPTEPALGKGKGKGSDRKTTKGKKK